MLLILGLIFVFGALYVQAIREKQFSLFLTTFSTTCATFSIIFFIVMVNLRPDVRIDEEFLYVKFFFQTKKAKLDDILEVKRLFAPARKQPFIILFRKGLTPFHRLYGWQFGRSFYPGVYVGGNISDKDELERLLMKYANSC